MAAGWSSSLPDQDEVNAAMQFYFSNTTLQNISSSQNSIGRAIERFLKVAPEFIRNVASRYRFRNQQTIIGVHSYARVINSFVYID